MMEQENLFEHEDGRELRDRGIAQSIDHAEEENEGWKDKALNFLFEYSKTHDKFSGEMVRYSSRNVIPPPPSLRAWGYIMVAGAKNRWIEQVGYVQVTNPKAHRANAAVWKSNLFRQKT